MKAIAKFFAEARTELTKVTWPSRAQAIQMTLTVLGVSLIFALYITGADLLITEGVKWITTQSQGTQTTPTPNINIGDIETTPAQ